jgi:uncharacterized protein (TIGR02722 family)
MRSFLFLSALACSAAMLPAAGCQRETTYRDADSTDVSRDWSSTDIKNASGELGRKLAEFIEKDRDIAAAGRKPVFLFMDIVKETDHHLNTDIIVSQLQEAILQTGRVTVVSGEARQLLAKEYAYMASGNVDPKTQKAPGRQTGVDYIVAGKIENVRSRLDDDSIINYYNISLQMTHMTTGELVWMGSTETKKKVTK